MDPLSLLVGIVIGAFLGTALLIVAAWRFDRSQEATALRMHQDFERTGWALGRRNADGDVERIAPEAVAPKLCAPCRAGDHAPSSGCTRETCACGCNRAKVSVRRTS